MKTIGLIFSLIFCTELTAQKMIELSQSDYTQLINAHNVWRNEVNSPPLKWNQNLQKESAQYALELAKKGQMEHSGCEEGENLFWSSEQIFNAEEAVNAWASEKNLYRAGTKISESNFLKFGHYTQIIWHNTTEFGCGAATSKHGTYVVCRYNPAGNVIGSKPTR